MGMEHIRKEEPSIWDDKAFIRQLALLLALIVAISLYLIYYSVHRIDNLSLDSVQERTLSAVSLGEVEQALNGNTITLEILEDTFNDLAEEDLRALQMAQVTPLQNVQKKMKTEHAMTKSAAGKKRSVIEITSSPIAKSKPKIFSLKSLRKKFYATNDVKYALTIAQRLQERKKYKEALKWALIANELAPENERSWLLFAKTKLKMGKRKDAINILEAYLKTYDSPKIARFLKQIASKS